MSLDPKLARLARVTVAICKSDWATLRELRREAPAGEPDRAWREAVLQSHLFAGFPRLVEGYGVLEAAGGLGVLEPDELEGKVAPLRRGAALFDRIYGGGAERVRATLEGYHADFARHIATHAYAEVLARPGLTAAQRETLAVAALLATEQDRQLASHARGAVRCGADPRALAELPDALERDLPAEVLERGRQVIQRFGRHERER